MPTTKITSATTDWITLADAKLHLKVDSDTTDDSLISALIKAVQLAAEGRCQRSLITTTWELVQDQFDDALRLQYPRILSVASLKYIDTSGVQQTLDPSDYKVDTDSEPGWVAPAYGKAWPATRAERNAVRVRYTAGYGPAVSDLPADLVLWMKLHLAHYYERREATVVGTIVAPLPYADSLLDPYRIQVI